MEALYKYIRDLFLRNYRIGFYRAAIGSKRDAFGRGEVVPEFLPDPITDARTAICPVLDVKPPAGASMACISHDGIPALPLALGVIPDAAFPLAGMKCWVQADLNDAPDIIELGAGRAISIRLGDKTATISDPGDGTIRIAVDSGGKVVIDADRIELGEGAVDALVQQGLIGAIVKFFDTHVHTGPDTPPKILMSTIEPALNKFVTTKTRGS